MTSPESASSEPTVSEADGAGGLTAGSAGVGGRILGGQAPVGGQVADAELTPEQQRELREKLRLTFGAEAAMYERSRPSFPAAAGNWLVPDGAMAAADVGAGTGKFTRLLLERGLQVAAVEPDPGMRAELQRVLPDLAVLEGSGELIPLPDDSLDLVTFAQSWHWVDVPVASAEVARVLRPGGRLGLIWNIEARPPQWMVEGLRHEKPLESTKLDPQLGEQFGPLEHAVFEWTETVPKELFIERVLSRSRYLTLTPEQRTEEAQWIREAMERDPSVAGKDDVAVHQDTHCFRTTPI